MKKIFTYIAIATALIATSCVQENLDGTSSEGQVSLELFCTDLETRAAGDDAFNENKITHFDYFFFSDAEGTTPIYDHARVIGDQETFHTDKDEPFEKLSNGGYVYIVANYPGLIPASVKTLAQVLELPVSTDFQADYATKNANGFIMDNLGADGKLTQFKPTHAGEETTVKIGLSRLAVKTTLVINIAKEVAGIGKEIWRPVIDKDHLFVYFVNADKTNTMSATPMRRSEEPEGADPKDYFTYATTHGYTNKGEVDGMYQIVTDPSYTYPQAWTAEENGEPYYKIQLGWESSVKGMSPFYYKIPVPVPANDKKIFTLNRNTWYQLTLTLKVLGGTEDDYVLLDKFYCVADFADWSSPSESFGTTSDSAHYFDVPTLSYNIYSANTLDINFICDASATALAEITSIEYYDYSGSGADLISRTPANGSYDAAQPSTSYNHTGEGRTYSLEVNDAEKYIRFTHDISDLYVVRTIKVRVYKSTERNIYRDVTIQQHPAIELKKAADADGNLLAEDLFVNGYFASVRNSADEFGSTRDGDGYYHCRTGWSSNIAGVRGISANTIGYGNLVHIDDIDWVSKPFFMTDISISAFSENNKFYKIKVNDANEETVYYRVGDPRLNASDVFPEWSLYPYLFNNGGNEDFAGWERPGEIKVTSKDNLARNMIAPHFLVSSGATEEITDSYDETPPDEYMPYVKRAATYQEAGYPAGRWRLPTEAEIAFIAARQRDKTLPTIFNVDVTYFAASGRFVIIPSDGSDLLFFSEDRLDDTFTFGKYIGYTYRSMIDAKFVYDLWYWGTEPMAANVYHPNQHIEN